MSDTESNKDADGRRDQRLVRWFVRGTKPDGTRWESTHKHDTREAAAAEIERWGLEMGAVRIMREISPPNEKSPSVGEKGKKMDNIKITKERCLQLADVEGDQTIGVGVVGAPRPSDAAGCSRIPDPEGKHLEVCRLQLAATVERLEVCREFVEWSCRQWEHRRKADWPPALLRAARALKIVSENAQGEATHPNRDKNYARPNRHR